MRAALDAGVNFLDTAENYGTEDIVGQAVKPAERDKVVISTKTQIVEAGQRRSPQQVVASLHASLKRLRTERVAVHSCRSPATGYAVTGAATFRPSGGRRPGCAEQCGPALMATPEGSYFAGRCKAQILLPSGSRTYAR